MKAKLKKNLLILIAAGSILVGYFFWLAFRPVKIIAVHDDGNYSSILVKNFPVTDKGKIEWWLENKKILKTRYNIPKPASYGSYDVTFWDFGDGYKKEKYDRLCFDEMKATMNCIDKKAVFTIKRFNDEKEIFITYEGRYQLQDNGEIMKIHRE